MDTESRLKKLEEEMTVLKEGLKQIAGSIEEWKNKKENVSATNVTTPQKITAKPTQKPTPKLPSVIVHVKCSLCQREVEKSKVYDVKSSGTTTYECVNSTDCRKEAVRVKDELRRNRLTELERNVEDNYEDLIKRFGSLEKEEQLEMMFNVKLNDLSELPRMRDGCIHYEHEESGQKYTWSLFKKAWSLKKDY